MKKTKRILALVSAVILIAMYSCTLIFAFIDTSKSMELLMASIACTIILPVLLYAYILVYRLIKKQSSDDDTREESDS